MNDEIPKNKLQRGLVGSKAAARVGGRAARYLLKKPFQSEEARQRSRAELSRDSAGIVFNGLAQLRGTALKIAQMLSLEMDLFPEEIRRELEKSYNQAPPINRALVRKVVIGALGRTPEEAFKSFDERAFAAASLGQVHRAVSKSGENLAVKVQYPGMRETIRSDIQIVRAIFRPLPEYRFISPALEEIEARLMEETDYEHEYDNLIFFRQNLKVDQVSIPEPFSETSARTVLSLAFVEGAPLNEWLKTCPSQEARDEVAHTLRELSLYTFYELNWIHADPNPGNFIIREDNSIGLIDFGCVKKFPTDFVELHRRLPRVAADRDAEEYLRILQSIKAVRQDLAPESREKVMNLIHRTSQWFSRLYQDEYFDFKDGSDFIAQGQSFLMDFYRIRDEVDLNPDMLYMNRTYYGLIRLYEMLRARVKFRNAYEWEV